MQYPRNVCVERTALTALTHRQTISVVVSVDVLSTREPTGDRQHSRWGHIASTMLPGFGFTLTSSLGFGERWVFSAVNLSNSPARMGS